MKRIRQSCQCAGADLEYAGEGTISEAAWEKIQAPMGQIEEQWGRQEISRQEYEKGIISLLKSVWGTEK